MANSKNLSSGVLASNISSSDTSISVNTGSGSSSDLIAVWPDTPFYITVMPYLPAIGVANSLDSEIMLVTALSSDGLTVEMTVTRGQKNTNTRAFNTGAVVTNGIYTDDTNDFIDKIYPVGTVYTSTALTSNSDVEAQFGGSWVLDGNDGVKYTFVRTA